MTQSKPRRFQFSLRLLLLFVAACALALGGARFLYSNYLVGPLQDSHAGLQVAAMINAYLDANGSAWPTSWDDLHDYYQVGGMVRGSDYCTFAEVRDSWIIDFQADPVELARTRPAAGQPPFRVIRQRYNRRMAYPQWDPNLRVFWRLRAHAKLQAAAMIIEYMKANHDAWPSNWEDLRRYYPVALTERGGHYCPFEQASGCIVVDFDADPAELARATPHANRPPFRVVYPRYSYPQEDAIDHGGRDPNQRIFEYLTSRNSPDAAADDKSWPSF